MSEKDAVLAGFFQLEEGERTAVAKVISTWLASNQGDLPLLDPGEVAADEDVALVEETITALQGSDLDQQHAEIKKLLETVQSEQATWLVEQRLANLRELSGFKGRTAAMKGYERVAEIDDLLAKDVIPDDMRADLETMRKEVVDGDFIAATTDGIAQLKGRLGARHVAAVGIFVVAVGYLLVKYVAGAMP